MAPSRRQVLICSSMVTAGVSVGVFGRQPQQPLPIELSEKIPAEIGIWREATLDDVVLPPQTSTSREAYESLVMRRYTSSFGLSVDFVAAYQPIHSMSSQVHRPEICYPASGFSIKKVEDRIMSLDSGAIPTRFFRAKRGERIEDVLFWTRIGEKFPATLSQQRKLIAVSALKRKFSDGVLVRVSTQSTGAKIGSDLLIDFVRSLEVSLDSPTRELFFGQVNRNAKV